MILRCSPRYNDRPEDCSDAHCPVSRSGDIRSFAADLPTITVTGGQIRGGALEKGGAVFKGIPFAQAPVGDLRWREPAAVKTWTGVRESTTFGAPCAQNAGGRMQANSSEDCLFLNVWTPDWPVRGPQAGDGVVSRRRQLRGHCIGQQL